MRNRIFFISLCIMCIMPSILVIADEDCDQALREGKSAYNAGDYEKAKSLFEYVKTECGTSYENVSSWIKKCQNALTPTLSVSQTDLSFDACSGSTYITVKSNRTWNLSNASSSLFTVNRSGDIVTINYSANPNESSRSDYFDIVTNDGSKSTRVYVRQKAKTSLSISPSSLSFDAAGGSKTINISSNTEWTAYATVASWGHLTRKGNTLTLTVDANTGTNNRSTYFKVKAGELEKQVNISQNGITPTLSVSPTSLSFDASGGSRTITISTNVDWSISINTASWGHLTQSGNTLTLRVDANTSSTERNDYFIIKAGSKEARVNISQKAAKTTTIEKVWVEHNIAYTTYNQVWNGYFWQSMPQTYYVMRIHVRFSVAGRKGEDIRACAYFYHQDGTILKGSGDFCTSDGQATVQQKSNATYDNTLWEDFVLNIPYSAMKAGTKHDMKFRIEIHSSSGSSLASSDWTYFRLN